jgi:hypothetical protein
VTIKSNLFELQIINSISGYILRGNERDRYLRGIDKSIIEIFYFLEVPNTNSM